MHDYKEFLDMPEVRKAFEDMYEKEKQSIKARSLNSTGFDKLHLEIASIKMSVISTDLYFSEIHKNRYK